jgi:predicted nucleic acid-binding protein
VAPVFVDTVAWIALISSRDSLYQAAWRMFGQLQSQTRRLVTTEFVLLEVADALASPPLRARVILFLNGLRQNALVEIVAASGSNLADGWALYCGRPDKEWGLTDCISFALMTQRGIHL